MKFDKNYNGLIFPVLIFLLVFFFSWWSNPSLEGRIYPDTYAYIHLAEDLSHPSNSLRPFVYPILFRGAMKISPDNWPKLIVLMQMLFHVTSILLIYKMLLKYSNSVFLNFICSLAIGINPNLLYFTSALVPTQLFGCFLVINLFLFLTFPVKSDQSDTRLPNLFQELYDSTNDSQINQITRKIWNIWHETNDIKIEADFYRGMESLRTRDFIMSIAFFTRVIEEKPNFAEAWNKRATVYYMMGDFDKSMYDINETLKLEPRHFGAMDGMGLIFMHLHQYEKAIKIYEQMLEIFPNNQTIKNKKKLMEKYLSKSA